MKLTKGQKLARDLGDMAPNELTPYKYHNIALNLNPTNSRLLNDDDAVGSNSVANGGGDMGYVVELGDQTGSDIYIVGKGITFDSGGYSIKPSFGMHMMQYDMMGSASVLGSLVDLDFPRGVTAEICIADNMIGPHGMLPGHIITYPNGVKVVVENTDAEGRLVLADGIIRAVKRKPKLIITVATLTGAVVAALGKNTVGVFSTDDSIAKLAVDSFVGTGIAGWHMPILKEECLKAIKRPRGLISNSATPGVPGHSSAATFLTQFSGDIPLLHLDIAGVAYDNKGARTESVLAISNLIKVLKKKFK